MLFFAFPKGKAPLCKEDSPIRGNVVEDDKRVTWLSVKQTEVFCLAFPEGKVSPQVTKEG